MYIITFSSVGIYRSRCDDSMKLFDVCFHFLDRPGPRPNIKVIYLMYGDSHDKDKTVAKPSYLSHGILYWQDIFILRQPPGRYYNMML